jgi:hypothetical protein
MHRKIEPARRVVHHGAARVRYDLLVMLGRHPQRRMPLDRLQARDDFPQALGDRTPRRRVVRCMVRLPRCR